MPAYPRLVSAFVFAAVVIVAGLFANQRDQRALANPATIPSSAPCTLHVGFFHIGLKHVTGGKCAESAAPQSPMTTSVRGVPQTTAASGSGPTHTCSTQNGKPVCVTRDGNYEMTCAEQSGTWACTSRSTAKTQTEIACETHANDPVPDGPALSLASYSIEGANAYVRSRDWKGLLAYSNGWTHAKPNDAMSWNYLGNTYGFGLHDDYGAAAAFRRTIQAKPSWALPYVGLGHAYLDEKCFDLSGAALEKAADRNRTSLNYWGNAAAAYSYAGRYDRAAQMLDNAQRYVGPHASAAEWYNIANGFNKVNEPQKAVYAYRRSLALNSNYSYAWNNLGVANQTLGNYSDALTDYHKAAALGDPISNDNYTGLQNAIAMANRHSGGGGRFGGPGGSGSSGSGGGAAAAGCMYTTAAACNAAKAGEYWAADRIDSNTASGSEQSWYGGTPSEPSAPSSSEGE